MKFIVGQVTCANCGTVTVTALDCDEPDLDPEECEACGALAATGAVFFAASDVWPTVDTLCEFARASRDAGLFLTTIHPKPEH